MNGDDRDENIMEGTTESKIEIARSSQRTSQVLRLKGHSRGFRGFLERRIKWAEIFIIAQAVYGLPCARQPYGLDQKIAISMYEIAITNVISA